jgi:hypothetical protein
MYKWIDSFDLITLNDNVSWERDYPYNQVKCKDQYDDPFRYFTSDNARRIKKVHSLKSDLHWIKATFSKNNDQPFKKMEIKCSAYLKRSRHAIIYVFLVLIGFPTLGLTWPLDLRIWLLSLGDGSEKQEQDSKSRE